MAQSTLTPDQPIVGEGKNSGLGIFGWINRYIGTQNLGLLLALLILVIAIGSQKGDIFFRPTNLLNIGLSISIIGLVAIAETMVMLSGGLDLSIGSTVGMASVGAALAIQVTHEGVENPIVSGVVAGIIGALIVGLIAGLINGALVTFGKLNAVIATLATLSVFKGFAYVITDAKPIGVSDKGFNSIADKLFDIPIPLLILIVVGIVFVIFLRYTDIGRNIYAMGGNPVAARLSGISLNRYKIGIYVISGLIGGIAGVILTARTNSGQPASGSQGLEFQAITAAVLGGTALSGGKGTIIGTLLGVIIIGTLNNGMTLLGIQTFYQEMARGLLLITATLIQIWQLRESRSQKAKRATA